MCGAAACVDQRVHTHRQEPLEHPAVVCCAGLFGQIYGALDNFYLSIAIRQAPIACRDIAGQLPSLDLVGP